MEKAASSLPPLQTTPRASPNPCCFSPGSCGYVVGGQVGMILLDAIVQDGQHNPQPGVALAPGSQDVQIGVDVIILENGLGLIKRAANVLQGLSCCLITAGISPGDLLKGVGIRRARGKASPCTTAWGTRGPSAPRCRFSSRASLLFAAQTTEPGGEAALSEPGTATRGPLAARGGAGTATSQSSAQIGTCRCCHGVPSSPPSTFGSLLRRRFQPQCLLKDFCLVPRCLKW